MLQKLLSHGNAPPPDTRLLRPQVSDDLVIVINKMLAKDPEHRYATGIDLISDLREVAFRDGLKRSQGIPAVSIAEPNRAAIWLEYHAPWLIAAMLLLISTAWLQLVSTASRNEFDLSVPSSAMVMRDSQPSGVSSIPDQKTGNLPTAGTESDSVSGNDNLILNPPNPDDMASESGRVSESVTSAAQDSFAVPPRLADVAIPMELDSQLEDSIFADSATARDTGRVSTKQVFSNVAPRLIRVLATEPTIEQRQEDNGIAYVTTLADAIAIAKRYQIYRIEIASPVIQSGPVRIDQDGLLITVSEELQECIIEMRHQDSLAMQRFSMIDIGSHQIDFEYINFVWKIAGGEFDGGSLMTVSDNRLVRMTDCTITIDNPSRLDSIYAFEVVAKPESTLGQSSQGSLGDSEQSDSSELPLVAIELNNVIIRGQMTMIHMDQAVELQLQWENGLLAINQRMIDTMGSSFQPAATASAMQLSLTRVTALIPQGLVRMRLGVGSQFPVAIDREAESCVFVVDEGTPHVEISGLSSFDEDESLLKLRGEANAYDVQPTFVDPFLLLSDNQGNVQITRMEDLKSNTPSWSDETSPRWQVRWATLRFNGSMEESVTSRLDVDDFRQYGTVVSGFNSDLLPQLPVKNDPLPTQNGRF
jgi:eukaryotic-like serine/threonine-protein kinase